MGWNLGKKEISIHLLDPLTSSPIIGTKVKNKKQTKKRIIDVLNRLDSARDEKKIRKITPIPIKNKCLKKK